MQPFLLSEEISKAYGQYIETSFPLRDPLLAAQLRDAIANQRLLGTGPILSLQRPFAHGGSVADVVDRGELHPAIGHIFRGWELRAHQIAAFERLSERGRHRSTIVATGTGSGKTEAFLLPILDHCARHPGDGVKALVLYPMNALANDQLERLRRYLHGTGITFGRYTGDTPAVDGETHPGYLEPGATYRENGPIPREERFSRAAIRKSPPNILLTGYRMLEYLLVRREDQKIFRPGGAPSQLRYLVLDEVHTYAGALGAEVACLVRRLRGHVDRYGEALTCIGTSATVGDDQRAAVLEFARRLFAVDFDSDALVREEYRPPAAPTSPPALEVASDETIAALARQAESEIDDRAAAQLGAELKDDRTIGWLREQLADPQQLDDLVACFAQTLGGIDVGAARRQIVAYLLRGTLARDDDGPLLRPRLHVVYRGLAGAARCLRCDDLLPNGDTICPRCGSRALPLEVCRQCGQDYVRAAIGDWHGADAPTLHALTEFELRLEPTDELRDALPTTIRFVKRFFPLDPIEDEADDATTENDTAAATPPQTLVPAAICTSPTCGRVVLRDDRVACACGADAAVRFSAASVGKMSECPACRYRYGVDREPITALASSTAIGVSILTWLTLSRLPADHRRLLIFADSRQDTAYQAGYLREVTNEYTWRQLTYGIISAEAEPRDFDGFWKALFSAGRTRSIFPRENQQKQQDDLRFFLVQEFTREAQRRTSLESLGLVGVAYRDLSDLATHTSFDRFRRACAPPPGGAKLSDDDLLALLATTLDLVRWAGALSDEFALRWWDDLEALRGVDKINRRPVAFRRPGASAQAGALVQLKPLVGVTARRTTIERFYARVGVADPRDAVTCAAEILQDEGLLAEVSAGGTLARQRANHVLAVNAGIVALAVPQQHWRCRNCGMVNLRNVAGRCVRPTCEGATLGPMAEPDAVNFYVRMYREAAPIRLVAQEHSGQIAGDKREEYEREFREGKIDVLVASPTLELGVDIGSLETVLLRGLPPSPANYAQRAGRAGRRERIALVNAYAQPLPHDAYFFNHPREMIAGRIPAPHFELENETIVRRHIRSLALEKLDRELPRYMRAFLNLPSEERLSPEDYASAELVTRLDVLDELKQKRAQIVGAVQRAFRGEESFACLAPVQIGAVIDEFEHDLWSVLGTWHAEIRQIATEIARINRLARPSIEEDRRRSQLQRTLGRLTSPASGDGSPTRNEAYTLGYLSNHGFLPSYAFPGDPATLFSRDLDDGEVTRDPLIALAEFAPGALVYIDGKKIACTGVTIARSRGGAIDEFLTGSESRYFRCSGCGHHATEAWIGACPECRTPDGIGEEKRVEARFFRGRADSQIGASEERRRRTPFEVEVALLGVPLSSTTFRYDGAVASYRRRQRLLAINAGRKRIDGGVEAFKLCLECGDAMPSGMDRDAWEKEHLSSRKHKLRFFEAHLTHEFNSDVLTIEVPGISPDAALTLRYALLSSARVEFQAEEGEIDGFERPQTESRPATVVLYETVNGGAGYLRRAAEQLPRLAKRALAILEHEASCVRACYQCLLTYYNQRDHERIDKTLVEPLLRDLASQPPAPPSISVSPPGNGAPPRSGPNGQHESPIEILLDAAMRQRLPPYEIQGEIRDPSTGALVTIPDMLFPDGRVAVYADGAEFHSTPEQIAHDQRVRTRARELGYRILAFPGKRIVHEPAACVDEIVRALQR